LDKKKNDDHNFLPDYFDTAYISLLRGYARISHLSYLIQVKHSETAEVKLLHNNCIGMYHVFITIYFCMILIQVTRFKRSDRKEFAFIFMHNKNKDLTSYGFSLRKIR